ncbi:MAG TPA: FAD-dependent oxidoreductase [Gemmatimonadaceae bacterium]|nr:FAD-dependent oxidoreductase [Gemmatimonadaceae bacterium]
MSHRARGRFAHNPQLFTHNSRPLPLHVFPGDHPGGRLARNQERIMGGGEQQLTGPDFRQGIPLSDIADGAMVLGHADGEPVVLARQGTELFAVGGTCTHYGGPLAEGLMVGETVHCPWHHACFSLRTGEALHAPALNPIPCWRVEQQGDTVRVTEKTEHAPLDQGSGGTHAAANARGAVVIVGAGAAGCAAAEMLRRMGYGGTITMLDADEPAPYDRPNLSKDYLAGNAPEEWIPIRPPDFYDEHGITYPRGARVASIDTAGKRVVMKDGSAHRFDTLLLATGSEPVRLSIPGADKPHVHYLRTLADSRAIIAAAGSATRAVVIGASFIGLEVAASLRARSLEVHVVAPDQIPFARILGDDMGRFIRSLHEERGVVFHLEQTATRIDDDAVTLANGETIAADLVVIGIGVLPRIALAEAAGVALDRGVQVNEYLETSIPGIYAAGDIARWPYAPTGERIRVEHWVVAERQGQTAARNMAGVPKPFDAIPFFWSQHYDVAISYVGHAERWDRIDIDGSIDARDCMLTFRRGDETLAVATIFRDHESLEAEAAMERIAAKRRSHGT